MEVRMVRALLGRQALVVCAVVFGLAAVAAPGYAQTGQVKGKVLDAKNQPIEGAKVTVEVTGGMNRKYDLKTNKKGEFIQIGLTPGDYKVTAEKDGMTQNFTVHIGMDMKEVNFTLKPGGAGGEMTKEERAKAEARVAGIKSSFEAGVALSNEGKYDEAVAKFNEVIAQVPKCAECYSNIGAVYMRKKDFDQAEAAYKKAIEIDPNSADAYSGLATVYNSQKKFEEAAEASAQAMKLASAAATAPGGSAAASASTVFNQGVIAWNAGRIADAKKMFEQAVTLDANLADAHYWLAMANLNEGKLPEAATHFEHYLKLAPTGQYAEQAKGILPQIKK
jgi:tetratricopeptide (TPR) repeat protein